MEKLLRAIKQGKGAKVELLSRYEQKKVDRSGYLSRGKEYSRMSLPYILPESDSKNQRGGDANDNGFNGFNAQCVNHLANRIVHNLFPAHQPFFQLDWTQTEKENLQAAGYEPTELVTLLNASVKRVHDYEGQTNGRLIMVNVMKHLIISGNVCLFIPPDQKPIQAIPLSHYTVTRDSSDDVTEIFTSKKKALVTFDEDIQVMIKAVNKGKQYKADDDVEIITWAVRTSPDEYTVVQVADDVLLADLQTVSAEELPWLPLRWNTCYGEDYGRGLVEDQISDLRVLEFLNEARMKGMVLMSDVKYLVKAGAVTDIDELATSPTGEFLVGSLDEIGVLQLDRYADFTPIINTIQDYERRLGQVFLMHSAVQRDAERVTAYEIRMQAQELNEALGGIYSHLALTLQKPYAFILMKRTGFPLGKEKVQPRILTGLEALSKASDLDKIRIFTETLGMMNAWNPELQQRTDVYSFALHIASSLGLDLPYIRDDEEQAQVNQAQQQSALEQQAGMEATKAVPKVIEQGAAQMMPQQS